jgi:RecA-family ATPase|nr:MAG TPA: Regulatory protein repA [Caudoviricetes sp.]
MSEESYYDMQEVLDFLDPSEVQYQDFVVVGMALKDAGYPFSIWEDWARRDTKRYKGNGNMERKWEGFGHNAGESATLGSIVQLARDHGWSPAYDPGCALGWDDEYSDNKPDGQIVDPAWVESSEIEAPTGEWHGYKEIIEYLQTLFEPGEYVGYVTESWKDEDERWKPSRRGDYRRTAGELIEGLTKHKDDLDACLGKYQPEAGAWIRFNPLDGQGVRNDNVAEFRYALVESDSVDIEKQKAIIEALELPVAALVHSGNKSIHAIVKIDAKDYDEYRKRVDFLYTTCAKNGLKVDTQNKNPSRLSRMPGVWRGENKQFLIATNIGKENWNAWREWFDEINDDLPEPESLSEAWDDMPELAEPLIDGVLRQGHKMLLAGPSKAGKSFGLIELCIAIAEGQKWLGWKCTQGRVLYVNLELDRASCLHRFKDAYTAQGLRPNNVSNIDIWNLRGKSKPMDKLAPGLIRRALKTRPIAVIIDPIYKVITGDENSADQMAAFCNQFDRVCTELGCAVIYCHHHSKGNQGSKRSMDRASGSGVFARDPDALLDLIELELTDEIKEQQRDMFIKSACELFLDNAPADAGNSQLPDVTAWRESCPDDTQLVGDHLLSWCRKHLKADYFIWLSNHIDEARKKASARSGWRIEGTLREFPKFEPVNVWFDYPVHSVDEIGILADIDTDTEVTKKKRRAEGQARKTESNREKKIKALRAAMTQCQLDGVETTRKNIHERLGEIDGKPITEVQLREWTKPSKNDWCPIKVDQERSNEGILVDMEMQEMLASF